MIDNNLVEDLFHGQIKVNQMAFEAGLIDVAFYALESALHCARELEHDQALLTVHKIAIEQGKLLSMNNHSHNKGSSQLGAGHDLNKDLFIRISDHANTILNLRAIQRDKAKKRKTID